LHLYDKKLGDFEVIELTDLEVGQQWKIVKNVGYSGLYKVEVGSIITVTEVFGICEVSAAYGEGQCCMASSETKEGKFDICFYWTDIFEGNVKLVGNTDD
jgi:hypothetical protein